MHDGHACSYAEALQQQFGFVEDKITDGQNFLQSYHQKAGEKNACLAASSSAFSLFDEIPEAASRAAAISGLRDPFHNDWPFWCELNFASGKAVEI